MTPRPAQLGSGRKGREGDLVRACIQLLTARGWLALRQNVARIVLTDAKGKRRMLRQGEVGMVDVLAFMGFNGVYTDVLGIECKRPGNKPTPEQLDMHARLRAHHVRVLTIYDIADLAKEIA